MTGQKDKRVRKNAASVVRSVRTSEEVWEAAGRRAEAEGVTMNHALGELLEGYARGMISLPRIVKQYRVSDRDGARASDD